MRILYIHQYFNTPSDSGGTRSYEMARRLVKAGHQVHIITGSRNDDAARGRVWLEDTIEGINIQRVCVPYSNNMTNSDRIKAFLEFAFSAGRRCVRIGGDVVFASSTPLTVALPAIYASKRLKVPMIFEVRDLWPEVPIAMGALRNPLSIAVARWLEKFAYSHSSHVVALSPGMADGVVQAGYPRSQVSVIPNLCNFELFQNADQEKQKFLEDYPQFRVGPIVVYTGTLGDVNGVTYLVEIASAMKIVDPEVKFLIVGDGKAAKSVNACAIQLGVLNKNLWILPRMPKNRIAGIMSLATVATSLCIDLPELRNNSANKFFDALAAGRPIMINYKGWQEELLKQTGAGISIPSCQPLAAAKELHTFLRDECLVREAGRAAFHLGGQFDKDVLAEKLLTILEQQANRNLRETTP